MTTETLNSLANASSSYLRSAMHQPIQWHEWGEEAFAKAKREDKPILLDIGAVWCHWCHVMDRESYDDPDVAAIINDNFVAVKVDRDERPDVDSRYQAAVSAITGQGGWPLTAFLTTDGKPFYGGTYFPPNEHWGRPSFKRVLLSIAAAFKEKRPDVAEQARMVEGAISQAELFASQRGKFKPQIIDSIVNSAVGMFDNTHGGFGSAPKFPHPGALDLLIDQYVRSGNEQLRQVFVMTLEKMARGGVYDQLAGGFHRYSVDERWVVPHFEKMTYDNSELLKNYVHAYQATGSDFFRNVAQEIVRWMDEWLSDRSHGGFYASQDADYSMDDDGDYFTWTLDETREVLSKAEANAVSLYYDINEVGEMHHNPAKNVLYIRASQHEVADHMQLPLAEVHALLQSAREKMYAARLKRPTPYVDKTLYVGWNSLCISAYLEAARAFEDLNARRFALKSLDRLLAEAWRAESGLKHLVSYSDPKAEARDLAGLLDDYAFTVMACVDAYETTADLSYFNFARHITNAMIERFFDETDGGFFDRVKNGSSLLGVLATRRKPFQDSPTPAGNSSAAIALLRMYGYTNDAGYREKAEQTLDVFAGVAEQYGIFAATYAIAGVYFSRPHTQVVIVGKQPETAELLRIAVAPFAFNKSVICAPENQISPQNLPAALAQTIPNLARTGTEAVALVCSGFTCQAPISDGNKLASLIASRIKQGA